MIVTKRPYINKRGIIRLKLLMHWSAHPFTLKAGNNIFFDTPYIVSQWCNNSVIASNQYIPIMTVLYFVLFILFWQVPANKPYQM